MQEFRLKDYNVKDTIAAIATPVSKAALGIIRISGRDTFPIITQIFVPKKKKDLKSAKTHTLHYGWITDKPKTPNHKPKTEFIVDEVLVSLMHKPSSYTGQDMVEISSHGGVLVLNKILEAACKRGARLALPGEFTYRALINGKIDLLRAESILNIVEARSEEGLMFAVRQLRGDISRKIDDLKDKIKSVFVETEAYINFPEDDVAISLTHLKKAIRDIEKKVKKLLEASKEARVLKEGLRCVICGKANAGKSTLFNRLLKEERVIVSKIPGTTRDVIEETINIKGIPLRIYDTAGILEPKDLVAKRAVEKSRSAFDAADTVILVLDGSRPLDKDDFFLLEKVKNKDTILVVNKSDLKQRLRVKDITKRNGRRVSLSALKNVGIKGLQEAVFKSVYKRGLDRENIIFLNHFQQQCLARTVESIARAKNFLEQGYTIDFVNIALRESLDDLGKLTGQVLSEDILSGIFSNFCIGK
ncbi:MAG: tRNA uridine-5-carboxymethylaminomethyl(34) synthesis GTPase MnmE [Candidatus Omnitrophota bacterium]|nr:MAG: tRNA uridine-5-carboxymethylaminomethyl(34) synthesis GTPase MnmE [Candidatus Omnitrophota bacterium]